VKIIFIEYLNL